MSCDAAFQLFKSAFELRNASGCCRGKSASLAAHKKMIGDACNHCAVVSAKFQRRKYAVNVAAFGKNGAEPRVCGNSSASDNGFQPRVFYRAEEAACKRAAGSFLKCRAHIFGRMFKSFFPK